MQGGAIQVRLVLDAQNEDQERTEGDLQYLLSEPEQIDAASIERAPQAGPPRVQEALAWMPPARC